jgi:hypothetical protein
MTLDLTTLGQQVRQMSGTLAQQAQNTLDRTAQVSTRYQHETGNEEHWRQAVDLSRTKANWLFARPVEPLDTVRAVPPAPPTYMLAASDGSQVDVDRHGIATCYLINTGSVYLRYGEQPAARLSSQPQLYYRDEDLYLTHGARRIPIEGNYLNVRRDIEELRAAVAVAAEYLTNNTNNTPALVLQDGTLVRWALAGAEKFVQDHFLEQYLGSLDSLQQRGMPVASYISRPRATELIGTIRLMFCPDVAVDEQKGAQCSTCSDIHQRNIPPTCGICNNLVDADVLAGTLREGERGPLFCSMSRINVEAYRQHTIYFFYLRVGRELARIELPVWVADDPQQVDLVHSLIYDQCKKGQGYPVALARAHEQAIVRTADRRTLQTMIESSLLRTDLQATSSRKRDSKKRPAV